MPDFNFFAEDVVDETAPYVLPIKGRPVLRVRFAGESNREFFNAQMRAMRASRGARDADGFAEERRRERALYAKHVVVGWSGVVDRSGQPVPYSTGACEELLAPPARSAEERGGIPDAMFDQLRVFCSNPANFTREAIADAEAVAKN